MKIKKILIITVVAVCVLALSASTYAGSSGNWTLRQQSAHEIAQIARNMGLPEDDPIIVRAKELWNSDKGREQDIAIIARVIYWEAGNGCTEEHMLGVGRVILNRVADERFPDTVYDVVVQKNQYLPAYANGSSKYNIPADRLAEFENLARRVLDGEPYDWPENVIYQDNNRHGTGVYQTFGSSFGSTTYFCYG